MQKELNGIKNARSKERIHLLKQINSIEAKTAKKVEALEEELKRRKLEAEKSVASLNEMKKSYV